MYSQPSSTRTDNQAQAIAGAQTTAEYNTEKPQSQIDDQACKINQLQATIAGLEEQNNKDSQASFEAHKSLKEQELELRRARASKTQADYRRDAMRKKIERFPGRLARARANLVLGTEAKSFKLKDYTGAVLPQIRTVVRQLACQGVANERMFAVISAVACGLGIHIEGSISARTVSRVVCEGLVQARMQLGAELNEVKCE